MTFMTPPMMTRAWRGAVVACGALTVAAGAPVDQAAAAPARAIEAIKGYQQSSTTWFPEGRYEWFYRNSWDRPPELVWIKARETSPAAGTAAVCVHVEKLVKGGTRKNPTYTYSADEGCGGGVSLTTRPGTPVTYTLSGSVPSAGGGITLNGIEVAGYVDERYWRPGVRAATDVRCDDWEALSCTVYGPDRAGLYLKGQSRAGSVVSAQLGAFGMAYQPARVYPIQGDPEGNPWRPL